MGAPPVPAWFGDFLRAAFYLPCAVHGNNKKWCNLYCTDCMTPVCSDCRDDGSSRCRREHHLILQVVRSSYNAAVQIDGVNGIGDLFDGQDDIQVYRANRVRIFYLHSRGPSKAENGRASPYQCEACGWPLLDSDKRFCSITCKVDKTPNFVLAQSWRPAQRSIHHHHRSHSDENGELSNSSLSNSTSDEQARGDKRKAKHPRRSPMF